MVMMAAVTASTAAAPRKTLPAKLSTKRALASLMAPAGALAEARGGVVDGPGARPRRRRLQRQGVEHDADDARQAGEHRHRRRRRAGPGAPLGQRRQRHLDLHGGTGGDLDLLGPADVTLFLDAQRV